MMEWKDVTSYARGQEQIPTTFALCLGGLRVVVLSNHRYYPGKWVMHCAPFYDTFLLEAESRDDAQCEALGMVGAKVQAVVTALQQATEQNVATDATHG